MSQVFNQTITTVTNLPSFGTAIVLTNSGFPNNILTTVTSPSDADLYIEVWGTTDNVSSYFLISSAANNGKPLPRGTTNQVNLESIGPMYAIKFRVWTNALDSNNRSVILGGSISVGGSSSGVSSLNALTGALNIVAGANVTVTPSGSSVTVSSSGGATNILVGNTIFVDGVNGNDSTGTRGVENLPFLTVNAALAATGISSGDIVIVGPGTFTFAGARCKPPSGVSVQGAGQDVTFFSSTLATNLAVFFNPANNGVYSNFTIAMPTTANKTCVGIGFNTGNGDQVAALCQLNNIKVTGWCTSFEHNFGTVAAAGPINWKIINCDFESSSIAFESTVGNSNSWTAKTEFFNCKINAIWDGATSNNLRSVLVNANGATNTARFVNCYINCAGRTSASYAINFNGTGKLELDACSVYASNGAIAIYFNSSGTLILSNGTDYTGGYPGITNDGGGVLTLPGINVTNIQEANIIYVDGTYGQDVAFVGAGGPTYPFLTIGGAITNANNGGGATSGQVIFCRPGAYAIGAPILLPAGVHLRGASAPSVVLTYSANPNGSACIVPGSGSEISNITVNLTPPGVNTTGQFCLGMGTGQGGVPPSSFVVRDCILNGAADCVYFVAITTSACYGRFYNCQLTSVFDCVNSITVSGGGSLTLDFYACSFVSSGDQVSGNTVRGFANSSVSSIFRAFGCNITAAGNNVSLPQYTAGASAANGSIVEIHGCKISVSTPGGPLYSLYSDSTSGSSKLIVGADCSYDDTLVVITNGGVVTGAVGQIMGTVGTTCTAGGAATSASISAWSNDTSGQVTILPSNLSTGTLATLTFGTAKKTGVLHLEPANAAAQALTGATAIGAGAVTGTQGTSVTAVSIVTGSTGLAASSLVFNYSLS